MPTVATSPTDLLAAIAGSAHLDGERLSSTTKRPSATARIRDLAWTAAFSDDEATTAAAQWLVWEASQALGARSASIQALYERPRPGRGLGVHRARRSTCAPRPSTWRGRSTRPPTRADVGGGHPRARPERADLHVPAPDRLRDLGAGRRDRRGLAGSGLHPGRPLPVQRQEVRRRPRGDDRGDPARLPPGDRRRLPQHRHRFARRWSTCRSPTSTSSRARTIAARPS